MATFIVVFGALEYSTITKIYIFYLVLDFLLLEKKSLCYVNKVNK